MTTEPKVAGWLLDSDPALRWQVERDIAGALSGTWEATRAQIVTSGYGAHLLSKQDVDGQCPGGAYFPAGFFDNAEADQPGQPWIATTWALKDLREWGLAAEVLAGTAEKLSLNSTWAYDDLPYWGGEVDVCINSFTLASGAWLRADVSRLIECFPARRLADGGWNCEAEEGNSTRSSFHSTLSAVRGMLAYEQFTGDTSLRAARHGGEEYLLKRHLLHRATTGELVGDFATQFVYPNRYRYSSALVALDRFRDATLLEGTTPDPRLLEAVDVAGAARALDGTWQQGAHLPGQVWFDVDAPSGEPSKGLTLLGIRVLDWWDGARQERREEHSPRASNGVCSEKS